MLRDLFCSEQELERLGIYSLGKTLQACHCLQPGGVLTDLLRKMTCSIDSTTETAADSNLSLLHVLECVADQWKLLVGTSPISRFVAQLCKLTLGWTMTNPSVRQSAVSVQNHHQHHRPAAEIVELNEISHIEFSRHLNDSSSSSRSTSPNYVHLIRPDR